MASDLENVTLDRAYRLGSCEVDPATGDIRRGAGVTRMQPLAIDVLSYLAARPGQVIAREDIEAAVWKGQVVGYDSLTGVMFKLRKALGDDTRDPAFIETIPKKGYRLLVTPEPLEDAGARPEQNLRRRRPVLFGLIAVALGLAWVGLAHRNDPGVGAERLLKPIAVLPFVNLSGDSDQEVFADGITEDLITDLSKISGLFVIARDSSFAYKNSTSDVREVADRLGVRYVLEGSVRRAADTMRINVQLVDGETGGQMWAERYDGKIADVFKLQDEVAREVVSKLAVSLTSDEEKALSQAAKIDPEAYDLFLQGRTLVRLYSLQANKDARDFFLRALTIDPTFARAHAALALSYAVDVTFGWSADVEKARTQVQTHLRKALAYGPDTPQIHFTRAYIYGSERRMDEAIRELRQTVALDPNFADAQTTLGLFLSYAGKPDEAIKAIQTAMRLSPHHGYIYPYHLANAYFVMQRYDKALPILEEVLQRNQNFQQGRLLYIATLALIGRIDDAEWEVDEVLTALPNFSLAEEEARVRFVRPEDRARYIEGLRLAGLPG